MWLGMPQNEDFATFTRKKSKFMWKLAYQGVSEWNQVIDVVEDVTSFKIVHVNKLCTLVNSILVNCGYTGTANVGHKYITNLIDWKIVPYLVTGVVAALWILFGRMQRKESSLFVMLESCAKKSEEECWKIEVFDYLNFYVFNTNTIQKNSIPQICRFIGCQHEMINLLLIKHTN